MELGCWWILFDGVIGVGWNIRIIERVGVFFVYGWGGM